MPSMLVDLVLDEAELLSIVDRGASGDETVAPRIVLMKRRAPNAAPSEVRKLMTPEERAAALEGLRAKLDEETMTMILALLEPPKPEAEKADEMPEAEKADDMPDAEKAEPKDDKVAGEDLEKVRKVAPEVIKRLESAESANSELAKRLATLEDERATEAFAKLAKDKLSHVPGSTDETVSLLKSLSLSLDSETFGKTKAVLEKCSALISKGGVFSTTGASGASGNDGGTAQERLSAIAKRLQTEDPKLSASKAMIRAVETHPDLYLEARRDHLSKSTKGPGR